MPTQTHTTHSTTRTRCAIHPQSMLETANNGTVYVDMLNLRDSNLN